MASERGFEAVVSDVVGLLEAARQASARSVNSILTSTYWAIGRRIVEEEQAGRARAGYGEDLMSRLAETLTARFGRGFRKSSLFLMRSFFLAYRDAGASRRLGGSRKKFQSVSGKLHERRLPEFSLPWTHYTRLVGLSEDARQFYEAEALRGGWTVRQLERQIATEFYERTRQALRKAGGKPTKGRLENAATAEEELKDPYLLEFLGLKDEYSESDIEEGLIRQMESFLLELGGHFAFIGRQKRLRVGDQWYRMDLVLFHRRLRCLVIIDLKLGALTAADAGQMHLYLNYARENWTLPDENPPVGLILSAKRDAAVAHYALDGLPNEVVAATYRISLPDEKLLTDRINRSWKLLDRRKRH